MAETEKRVTLNGPIQLVPGRRGGRYPHCNSLLINSGERALIDPGSNRRELQALNLEGVGRVLLSHSHSDHVRDLKEFPGAEVMVHHLERAAVESWQGVEPLVWFPEETPDPTWVARKDREVGGWGWKVTGVFNEGEELRIGDVTAVVVHTPGHTPGHCSFWFPDHKLMFVADIDLTEFGPWYGNAGSGVGDFMRSIERIKSFPARITVTGHEAGVIEGDVSDRLEAYAAVVRDRHQRILDYLSEPRSLDEVTKQAFIYGRFYSEDNSLHDPEWRMVRHHLSWARERGEAEEQGGLWRRT